MRSIIILAALMILGCAPLTEQEQEIQYERHSAQNERMSAFNKYKRWCEGENGYAKIERYGKSTRRDEILKIPGEGDRVSCTSREHR